MDWTRYRQLCDRGDVLSRWLLLRTARILELARETALARRLVSVADGDPIAKPGDHRGGAQTDFFFTALTQEEVERITAVVRCAAADVQLQPEDAQGVRGMPEAWQEYAAWLDGSHPRSPVRRAAVTGPSRGPRASRSFGRSRDDE
jgi:hypothetical protein